MFEPVFYKESYKGIRVVSEICVDGEWRGMAGNGGRSRDGKLSASSLCGDGMEGKDKEVMDLANEFLGVMRSHTDSPADRTLVSSALVIAKNLYMLSAPSYVDQLESVQSLSADQ